MERKEHAPVPRLKDMFEAVKERRLLNFCSHHRIHCRRSSDKRTYLFTDCGMRRVDKLLDEEQRRAAQKEAA